MKKATDTVKLYVKSHQDKDYVPTIPPSAGGVNYYYLYTGGNDGNDGDIHWPVGIPTTTLNVKLKTNKYTINSVNFTSLSGGDTSNFSYEIAADKDNVVITDTNVVAETVSYCVVLNVPGGTVGCDPVIKNS